MKDHIGLKDSTGCLCLDVFTVYKNGPRGHLVSVIWLNRNGLDCYNTMPYEQLKNWFIK